MAQQTSFRLTASSTAENSAGDPVIIDKDMVTTAPFDYLLSQPGKNVRSHFILGFNQWLDVPKEKLDIIIRVIEVLHTASLLIDDIQDSSERRRGLPVAHKIFGTAQTINSANHAYFVAQTEVTGLENLDAFKIFTEELLNLHKGQGMDLFWRDTLSCPSEEEYLEMVSNKTGGLFRLAIRLMQLESKQTRYRGNMGIFPIHTFFIDHLTRDFVPLVDLLGIAFQIRDDYKNLQNEDYSENKGFCEDLTEGKFSFPIIHSIHANPGNLQLLNILRLRTHDYAVKSFAKKYMEEIGSLNYCRQRLSSIMASARNMVRSVSTDMGISSGVESVLDYLEYD